MMCIIVRRTRKVLEYVMINTKQISRNPTKILATINHIRHDNITKKYFADDDTYARYFLFHFVFIA